MSRRMGLTQQEIAAREGISPKTVEYHIGRALEQLKALSALL